ncbi:lipid-A-disaccharide synthase-related protein [[Limnothrix rosea] IAM M-220]|uniref:lipid-A-disaccharide synthase-related protein n=1 Tax=[Limnothrix rosea] IAM M-220 TaxID=454133 RepID=UPI000967C8BA|nr:lipid-A-disaccharide synthase-related protein [[Limnothrix rosea] IAM M-220]OKH17755.1 hypothetical protein NIES208_07995 [[Limnothrix rosea] IAM M-220]
MRILCLSNGHGEDAIAVQVLEEIQDQNPDISLAALPIVGTGHAYQKLDIPIIGRTQQMPSGGFVYMDNRQLARDIKGGLIKLTWQQYKAVKKWAKQTDEQSLILAVGDIVPLIFSLLSGTNYAFIGTAKSEYYLRDSDGQWLSKTSGLEKWFGSVYLPWERWLLSRKKCLAVYPRDRLTTDILQKYGIAAVNLGNPMMDGLEPPELELDEEERTLTAVLLPGSRLPEALGNWQKILVAVQSLLEQYKTVNLIAAIAPSLDTAEFCEALQQFQWQPNPQIPDDLPLDDPNIQSFTQGKAHLIISQNNYAKNLHRADLAIAMAGTATEQFVGLGKPAFTIVGDGPQFTPAFAEAQTRLLGHSVILLKKPEAIAPKLKALFQKPDILQNIAANGKQRMGQPGAAQRIATHILNQL